MANDQVGRAGVPQRHVRGAESRRYITDAVKAFEQVFPIVTLGSGVAFFELFIRARPDIEDPVTIWTTMRVAVQMRMRLIEASHLIGAFGTMAPAVGIGRAEYSQRQAGCYRSYC